MCIRDRLSNMHCKVVDECLQLFGGWGYMWEYPIARAYADARIVKIAGGSIEVMKHIIGRQFTDKCIANFMKGELDAVDAAMAKMWLSNLHCKVVDECLQLFGGWGYMWEYPIARAYADARIVKIAGGSIEVMKHIIGRQMFAEYQPAKGANGVAGINPA